jgi:ABC-type xylose transport system permease subunit
VVLTRNIDLSVGSIVGLSAYLTAATLAHHPGIPVEAVALISVAIGLGLGIVFKSWKPGDIATGKFARMERDVKDVPIQNRA